MNQKQTDKTVLFIGGHRKAGTSLIRDLFDGHSDVLTYPVDLMALYAYFPDFIKKNNSVDLLKSRLKRIIIGEIELAYKNSNVTPPNDFSKLEEYLFENLSTVEDFQNIEKVLYEINRSFILWDTNNASKKFVAYKETSLEIYAHRIFDAFPDAKILQIIRDPRDNYAALKSGVDKKYKHYGEDEKVTLFSLLNRLNTSLRAGLINQTIYSSEHYKIIKFEDLTNSPQETTKEISNWMKTNFEECLLSPTKFGQHSAGNNFDNKKFKTISNVHVSAWKERICNEEAQIIEFYLGDLMAQYGYETIFDSAESMKNASLFYEWSNYKYFYFDRLLEEEKHNAA